MKQNKPSITDQNLDRLTAFLKRELEHPHFSSDIPTGAHLFHGADNNAELTQSNLKLASKVMLGMTLGYIDESPMMMIYELGSGEQKLITLSTDAERDKAHSFIETFQETTQKEMVVKIHEMAAR